MATWPSALQVNRQGFKETPPDRLIRTQMETGADKLRRRFTNAPRPLNFKLFLTDAQVATLDAFYLANDAIRFNFTDPRTDTSVKARFLSPPEYSYRETMWEVSVSLEIIV